MIACYAFRWCIGGTLVSVHPKHLHTWSLELLADKRSEFM